MLTVDAVAVNVPLLAPELIVMLPGTLSALRLLERLIVALLVAALVSITVQLELCPAPNDVGVQVKLESCGGATRLMEKVREIPPAVAVTVAV